MFGTAPGRKARKTPGAFLTCSHAEAKDPVVSGPVLLRGEVVVRQRVVSPGPFQFVDLVGGWCTEAK